MPEALPLQPGDPRRLGSYEIAGRLGVGEQGAVFLGRDPSGVPVAVKVLHVRLSGEPVARARFAEAFTSARKVSGFYTAAILDADVEDDLPYVVSEWVGGPTLQQLVNEEGPRGGVVVERVAVGVAIALAAVHRAGAVHHNLKPGNVLLSRSGPKMGDFGIVHAMEAVNVSFSGHITEDPAYRSPEQLSGTGIGPATDVFAWASTLLFAATGRPPFGEGSPSEVMQRIMYEDADLSGVPMSLRDALTGALAKNPAERPTAKELLAKLLDAKGALVTRLPFGMVEEGRAVLSPPRATPDVPSPAAFASAPSTPPPVPSTPPGPPREEASPSFPLFGKLSRSRRYNSEPGAEPSAADLDPSAFEATATFGALGSEPQAEPGGTDRTATFDAVGADSTARFDAVDLRSDANTAEPSPQLIPGLGHGREGGGHRSPSTPSFMRMRRPGNHVLGLALSLVIGVSVGIAIIALVLWPQLKSDDGSPPDSTNSSNNRPVTTIPASFAGTWKGTLVNTNRNASFPVEITFAAGGTTGRAVYPREKCNGTLRMTRGTESALKMNLDIGKPCTSGIVQITRQPDGTLQYTWSKPGTALAYGGRLRRG
ncbi:serine/threonine-protein kinase [Actinomadura sp. B10D3]|uniref:serine/threonine protein kinase n=1 Tax=Actinomadura sp. B10D3 TaxID=3153557 RepID=UPI00325EFB17